ncbi:MAG: hypothetical protein R3E79_16400 [Caldilineaceae bacterium]
MIEAVACAKSRKANGKGFDGKGSSSKHTIALSFSGGGKAWYTIDAYFGCWPLCGWIVTNHYHPSRAGSVSKDEGFMQVETELNALAAKHGFSAAAVRQLYAAIQAGNGTAANFLTPSLAAWASGCVAGC